LIINKVQHYEDEMNHICAKYSRISWLSVYHAAATENYTSGLWTVCRCAVVRIFFG